MKYIYKWPRLKMPRSIPMIHTSLSDMIHTIDPYLTTTICTYTRPHLVYLHNRSGSSVSYPTHSKQRPDHPKRTSYAIRRLQRFPGFSAWFASEKMMVFEGFLTHPFSIRKDHMAWSKHGGIPGYSHFMNLGDFQVFPFLQTQPSFEYMAQQPV